MNLSVASDTGHKALCHKEADTVITLSGFSLAILYYRIINDRTQLEPRRIINQVKVSSTYMWVSNGEPI
eukprot:COSAG06_NODE_177_length_21031_cov_13.839528_5_plen_69_part_00